MYIACALLKAQINGWRGSGCEGGEGVLSPSSGLICETVNSVGQENFTFVRKKSGNFRNL